MPNGGMPWYLVPRAMGRWQRRLVGAFAPLAVTGFGFIFGWLMVHFPGRGDESGNQPAPVWLLWTGVGCVAAAVGVYAVARLTSPVYDSDPNTPSDDPVPVGRGCVHGALLIVCFLSALVASSLASASSAYRWHPLWMLGGIPIILLFAAAGRRRS